MNRIRFRKGEQRKFLDLVILNLDSPSLRGLLQFGFNVNYSTLKNYYCEDRLMPEDLFGDFCLVGRIEKGKFRFGFVDRNWGQVKGGKKKKRSKGKT